MTNFFYGELKIGPSNFELIAPEPLLQRLDGLYSLTKFD